MGHFLEMRRSWKEQAEYTAKSRIYSIIAVSNSLSTASYCTCVYVWAPSSPSIRTRKAERKCQMKVIIKGSYDSYLGASSVQTPLSSTMSDLAR